MADQCIVCLENLDVQPPPPPVLAPEPPLLPHDLQQQQHQHAVADAETSPTAHTPVGTLVPSAVLTINLARKPSTPPANNNNNDDDEDNRVAVIDVCGHTLHDACLREWTGKANSCPICRQAFHLVHVYNHVGGKNYLPPIGHNGLAEAGETGLLNQTLGTKLHSYKVEDKKQIAEFDPQAWLDENPEHEEEPRPCPICNSADREEVLLLCDSCDAPYHTFCVGLDCVPRGHWFCMECTAEGAEILAQQLEDPGMALTGIAGPSHRHSDYLPRTQATMRRARRRARSDEWQGAWGQLAGHVWDALSIDLDNDDDDESLANYRRSQQRRERERREYERWQQRLNIASRLGAHDVFASNLSSVLSRPLVQSPPPPPEETGEESQAWSALDEAMKVSQPVQATPNSRKRRRSQSVTSSPAEAPQVERKLKRPRTRRVPTQSEGSSSKAASSSISQAQQQRTRASTSSRPLTLAAPDIEVPSFLSNLLKEVEVSTPSEDETIRTMLGNTRCAPDPSSPATSPAVSAYSSPRALSLTPPPPRAMGERVASPLSLSSWIEPIYPPANFSPTRNGSSPRNSSPTRNGGDHSDSESRSRQHSISLQHAQQKQQTQAQQQPPRNGMIHSLEIRQPRPRRQTPSNVTTNLTVVPDAMSPTRMNLPFETKESISGIVKNALKPHWKSGQITADQYAVINRDLSRKLYEEVSLERSLTEDARHRCESIATKEVLQAVAGLKG